MLIPDSYNKERYTTLISTIEKLLHPLLTDLVSILIRNSMEEANV